MSTKNLKQLTPIVGSLSASMISEIDDGSDNDLSNTIAQTASYTAEIATYAALTTTDETLVGAINEVAASIVGENILDRTGTVVTFHNAGDEFQIGRSHISAIDPDNTSNTKSFEIYQTITGVNAGFEHARVQFRGLSAGVEKDFLKYEGASDDFTVSAQNWTYDNLTGNSSSTVHKVNLNTVGGTGWYFNKVIARNSVNVETIYYQDRAIIASNTSGTECGQHVFDVIESGVQTAYAEFNGLTQLVNLYKDLVVAGDITSSPGAVDGALNLKDASAVSKVYLDTNGDSYFMGGNVSIGTVSSGAGAAGVFAIGNGTQGAALANAIQIVSEDITAGNTTLSLRTEGTPFDAGVFAQSNRITIKVNGASYAIPVQAL